MSSSRRRWSVSVIGIIALAMAPGAVVVLSARVQTQTPGASRPLQKQQPPQLSPAPQTSQTSQMSQTAQASQASQTSQAADPRGGPPPLPFVEMDACPFECCQYRDWRASRPISAQTTWDNPRYRGRDHKTAFGIARGETVTAMTGIVVTTRTGHLRVAKDSTLTGFVPGFPKQTPEKVPAHTGDIIYLLVPHGENVYTVWYGGRVLEEVDMNDLMVAIVPPSGGEVSKDVLEQPAYDWWVRIRNDQGYVGWTDRARDFHGGDACSSALPSR